MRRVCVFAGVLAVSLLMQAPGRCQGMLSPPAGTRAEVLYFVASDCAYSDRYFPEMLRLQRTFFARGVSFRWIYPNQNEKPAGIRAHQRQFGASAADASLDHDGAIARLAKVHITPEAAVLVPGKDGQWITVYHGRIDDRYVRIGLERPHAEHHDLEEAVEAVLENMPAPPPGGSAVGCAIMGPLS